MSLIPFMLKHLQGAGGLLPPQGQQQQSPEAPGGLPTPSPTPAAPLPTGGADPQKMQADRIALVDKTMANMRADKGGTRLNIDGSPVDASQPTGLDWLNQHNETGGHSWQVPTNHATSGNPSLEQARLEQIFGGHNIVDAGGGRRVAADASGTPVGFSTQQGSPQFAGQQSVVDPSLAPQNPNEAHVGPFLDAEKARLHQNILSAFNQGVQQGPTGEPMGPAALAQPLPSVPNQNGTIHPAILEAIKGMVGGGRPAAPSMTFAPRGGTTSM